VPRPDPPSIDEILRQLEQTPTGIASIIAGVSPAQLVAAPQPGEWSALEILAHVRSCADVRGAAAMRLLAEDHPRFRDVSPRIHQRSTDYERIDFASSLQAFAAQRTALLEVLRGLEPARWARSATVIRNGKPVDWSVRWYGQWIASHEQVHLEQLRSTGAVVVADA
jgi:hypothetical protein